MYVNENSVNFGNFITIEGEFSPLKRIPGGPGRYGRIATKPEINDEI